MSRLDSVYKWSNVVLDACYPPTCQVCGGAGARGIDLCLPCREELPWLGPCCNRCALPLPVAGVCGQCQCHPPPFDAVLAPLRYQPPVDWLLQGLKFHGRLSAARLLGHLLGEALAARGTGLPDLIVPVPLHPARLAERGYNQALELARPLARQLGLPLAAGLCRRTRATDTQSLLPAAARRRNVRGAFTLTGPLPGSHVAIVDDVVTTGATVAELATTLRRAGATRVEVWAVARAG